MSSVSELADRLAKASERNNGVLGPVFEVLIEKLYQRLLRPGDDAVDGGANYGMHMIPMSYACRPSGTVYAFEPLDAPVQGLSRRIKTCRLDNVVLIEKALTDQPNLQADFAKVRDRLPRSGLIPRSDLREGEFEMVRVETTTLDTAIPSSANVRFVKLDLEGGEFHAMVGGKELLTRSETMVAFEFSRAQSAEDYGYTAEAFFDFFKEIEYSLYDIMGNVFTPEQWSVPSRVFYYLAVPRGSGLDAFINEDYPSLRDEMLDRLAAAPLPR